MPATKNKSVTVNVNGKNFRFGFQPVTGLKPDELVCDAICPLNNLCDKMRDPRDMNDNEASFNDFCLAAGDKDKSAEDILNDESIENLMPVMEDVAKFAEETDTDIYQDLIKANPLVKLGDVIDCMCGPDGYACSMYDPEHTNCTSKNGLCVLKSMFKV